MSNNDTSYLNARIAKLERAVAKVMALETVEDTSELIEDLIA